jgi:hypothetical protein
MSLLTALFLELTAGLLYPSESDRPFDVRFLQSRVLSAEICRGMFGIESSKPADVSNVEAFLGRWKNPQPWHDEGYRNVQKRLAGLHASLLNRPDVRVLCFSGIETHWVVALPDTNGFVLIHTTAVAT